MRQCIYEKVWLRCAPLLGVTMVGAASFIFPCSLFAEDVSPESKKAAVSKEPPTKEVVPLSVGEVKVLATREEPRFLQPVEEQKIYSGKKATVVSTSETPELTTNNYRQMFSRIPGLLTSEVGNEGFASLSYRGIGDPHESFNLLLLQDGIPLNVDPYGYSAAYFVPPIESISDIEFVRGGAGLLYGPLPGGALNFHSKVPPFQRELAASTKQVWGSKRLYATFNEVGGTIDDLGYRAFYHHRGSDGFRDDNSDYDLDNAHMDFRYRFAPETTGTVAFDVYTSDHGEAGGLGVSPAPGVLTFSENRFANTRQYDRLRVERYMSSFRIEHELDRATSITETFWSGFVRRYSKRQAQGTTPAFGGIANGLTNSIVAQEFLTFGSDTRLSHAYDLGGMNHTLTASLFLYGVHSPFVEQKGTTAWSEAGTVRKDLDRDSIVGSAAIENMFQITDSLRVTPGLRVENIHQSIDEKKNVSSVGELRSDDDFVSVPLLGLAANYTLQPGVESYLNISQGYRPVQYQDAVPLGPGDTISEDLDPTRSLTYEVGIRGTPVPWFLWDSSVFYVSFDDQVGRVGTEIQNVGNSYHRGIDLAGELELFGLFRDAELWSVPSEFGKLSLSANTSFLDAEFTKGPVDNKTPQYAPRYLSRGGVTFAPGEGNTKFSLLSTFVGNHYADDANSPERKIPSYKVWDLLAEVQVYRELLALTGGINNIFDESYYSRVRGNGIEPANPRNYYAGIRVTF